MVLLFWPKVELAISLVLIMPSGSYVLGQEADVKAIPALSENNTSYALGAWV